MPARTQVPDGPPSTEPLPGVSQQVQVHSWDLKGPGLCPNVPSHRVTLPSFLVGWLLSFDPPTGLAACSGPMSFMSKQRYIQRGFGTSSGPTVRRQDSGWFIRFGGGPQAWGRACSSGGLTLRPCRHPAPGRRWLPAPVPAGPWRQPAALLGGRLSLSDLPTSSHLLQHPTGPTACLPLHWAMQP